FLIIFSFGASAQIGGVGTYEFLNLPVSARTAALGGNIMSVKDNDINASFQNPSLLNPSMDNSLSLSFINYFAGINYGNAAYAKDYKGIGTFSLGMKFINYGTFTQADETGQITGTFKAAEYAFNIGYSRQIDSLFSVGVNLKTIYSNLAQYSSFGNAVDIGGTYFNAKQKFTIAAVIANLGTEWKTYTPGNREPLPLDFQIGISKEPKHAPVRLTIIAQHLQKWDLTYIDPNDTATVDPSTGQSITSSGPKWTFGDKFMRHIVLGGELLITQNFNLRVGFNYEDRKELELVTRTGMDGFSFGFGIKISKFQLSYGHAIYSLAGGTNHITVSIHLSEFMKKEQI
ncbi:MAG TPA: type IX secretion system protein PorQ, partial [Bacteroidia bacterium]|nr:type IX secretion system protein PorQ [Bacteroidia bacterium]